MCIGSNSVNQAQDLMFVTKFEDFPNSLIPSRHLQPVEGHRRDPLCDCEIFAKIRLKLWSVPSRMSNNVSLRGVFS